MPRRQHVGARDVPSPRLTTWGALMILLWLGLPLLAAACLLDAALYLVFTRLLGRCYGIFCWLS